MTTDCELCGRAAATKAITPAWWPYKVVCDRAGCNHAVQDAIEDVEWSRTRYRNLILAIGERHDEATNYHPNGYRQDAMSRMDVLEDSNQWFVNVAKRVNTDGETHE